MKFKDHNGQSREIPVHGCVTGLRMSSVELDAKDFAHLLRQDDSTIRDWLGKMLTRFSPSEQMGRPNIHASRPEIEMIK